MKKLLLGSTIKLINIRKIISGGARGVDTIAKNYTLVNRNIRLEEFIPNWKKYGRSAGIIRNGDIIKASNLVIAFWDGKSRENANVPPPCAVGAFRAGRPPCFINLSFFKIILKHF